MLLLASHLTLNIEHPMVLDNKTQCNVNYECTSTVRLPKQKKQQTRPSIRGYLHIRFAFS